MMNQVLLPTSAFHPIKSKLVRIIEENLPGISLVSITRNCYSDSIGFASIAQYSLRDEVDAIKVATTGKCFCVSSFAAILRYLETSRSVTFASHTLKISFHPSEGTMLIDFGSIRNLEMIKPLHHSQGGKSLLGLASRMARCLF